MADTPSKEESIAPAKDKPKNKEYVELKIPKLNLKNYQLSPIWVILLVVLSFFLGMQTSKIQSLESSLENAQANGTNQQAQQAPDKPALGEKVDIAPGTLPVLGKSNAKVTMIEFSDFQCPFCKQFFEDTFPQLKKDYIDTGKVKLSFRHLPLVNLHPNAPKAAEASECANDQQKFWDYHDVLFQEFDTWTQATPDSLTTELTTLAGTLGLNTDEFTTCLTSDKYKEKVAKDVAEGQSKGATGTPSFFINGKLLVGALPYETFKTLIDQELNGK